ncbi:zinc finger and BTB domain-containing protein 17 isoform X4 [Biomphalaria glabrata]|nr:zinc finger and BTB domain-containing protein 17 isoform X4 [Biomphalaria glabrata]
MPEQELNPAATKFISSLVRSLQILCNGQVEFNESIELVGHINVKIDHIYKFDYIVDEQVSKEGEDSSTTFLSNSYHSCRPTKQTHKKANPAELEQDVIFSEIPTDSQRRLKQMKNMHELEKQPESTALQRENSHQNYSVSVDKHCNEPNQMVVKLEGGEDSNDCMVLPASPVDYEGEANRTESYSVPGPSSSFDESNGNQAILTRKRRKAVNQSKDTEPTCKVFKVSQRKISSAAFSCKEYLARYNIYNQLKTKLPDRKEMLKVFSDLAQKYGVAITIKPVKFTTPLISSSSSQSCIQGLETNFSQGLKSNDKHIILSTPSSLCDTTATVESCTSKPALKNNYLKAAASKKMILLPKEHLSCNVTPGNDDNDDQEPVAALGSVINAHSEEISIDSHFSKSVFHDSIRQQPLPKHRGSYLVKLRKEDPDRYEYYKKLSKEDQAKERRRFNQSNQDSDVLEKKSLINRVSYLRKVGKLPASLVGKGNDEIRLMTVADLKSILPPSKSLRHMDPLSRDEWYRFGRNKEWRRKKKLLDPEGFKKYNNERAKKYQENLRNNNPEKFKELRAKAAERLRHYRNNQKVLKAEDIKLTDSLEPSAHLDSKRAELLEVESEVLIDDAGVKACYSLSECASTHECISDMVAESNNLYMSVEKIQNSSSNSRKEMSTNDNIEAQNKTQVTISLHPSFISQSTPCEGLSSENLMEKDLSYSLPSQSTPNKSVTKNEIPIDNNVSEPNVPLTSSNCSHPVHDLKQLVIKLAALCDLPSIQDEFMPCPSRYIMGPTEDDIRQAKKKFLEVVDKEKLKKIKEVLKMKKSKQKKQRLKALLIESGFSNEQLLLLAQDANIKKKRISWKSVPDGQQGKELLLKEHRKALRVKTQERHQKLLEMAEMLKRNQVNDPGITVVSKNGGKKCILHKSFVSVVSHNTQQLSLENIDEVAETLSGKSRKATLVQQSCQDKSKEQMKVEYTRRVCVKKKMKQIVAKMLAEISDAGYRVVVTSTIGSEVGSHSAELTVIPLKVDDFWPETKQSDVKPELTEDEYAKQLEREQILEKQKANEEKMKEMEIKLVRILTGAEEMFVPARKRYNPGEARPTDAERMKEYRKKLKQDPEKYQVYRQKRVMNKRRRRLGEYAAKVRVTNAGSAVSVIPTAPVTEEAHGSQTIGGLVSITQPVGGVSMHCSQVYDHPSSHQPTASVVNVHHGTQYVGQVAGMHPSHHQQQSITYGNEMDIVELIAATHNVQNQHFG